MTSAGIEPATFRFVAQHLNHCAAVPSESSASIKRRTNARRNATPRTLNTDYKY